MKLNDLPKETKLQDVVIVVPDELHAFLRKNVDFPESKEAIFAMRYSGPMGYFLKTPTTGMRTFPVWARDPREVLEWEVLNSHK